MQCFNKDWPTQKILRFGTKSSLSRVRPNQVILQKTIAFKIAPAIITVVKFINQSRLIVTRQGPSLANRTNAKQQLHNKKISYIDVARYKIFKNKRILY